MAEAKVRLTPAEYAAEKARKKETRRKSALALIAKGCPGVLTGEQFAGLIADQVEGGVMPHTFKSGKLGYMTGVKLVINEHRFQCQIMLTMIQDRAEVPTADEVAELERLSEEQLEAGETV